MNKENKCFFSISLENGIIITGNNLIEVRDFLELLNSALFWSQEIYKEDGKISLLQRANETREYIKDAAVTITNNLYNEE